MGLLGMARRSKYREDYDLFAHADDNRPSCVYVATNKVNGKRYVGMTRQKPKRRWDQHIASALRNGDKYSGFHRAIRKYGPEAFEFSVLCECATYVDAAKAEMRLISEIKPEHNQTSGGESIANLGMRPSEKSRKMSRERLLGKPGHWTGKKRPDIAEQQRARLTGRPDLTEHLWSKAHTPEARAKMRATRQAQGMTEAHRAAMVRRRKKIICLDDDRIFFGAQAVADALGCKRRAVFRVLQQGKGHRLTLFGLRFKYVDGE